jgi:hypothetical protein
VQLTRRREINAADHGASGDWDGVSGTDNVTAFNLMVAEAAQVGKPTRLAIVQVSFG